MVTDLPDLSTADTDAPSGMPNGAALAAFLAAGIGAFTMGLVLVLNESGMISVPALYGPSGGVSGRTTLAVFVWLVAWTALHLRWRDRQLKTTPVMLATVVLTVLGIVATYPPVWGLL